MEKQLSVIYVNQSSTGQEIAQMHMKIKGGREKNNSSRSTNGENVLFNLFVAKESENVTMFSGPNETKENGLKALRMETNGHAIIDSGCATNVCGEAWLENFKESLTSEDKRKIFSGRIVIGRTKRFSCYQCWLSNTGSRE